MLKKSYTTKQSTKGEYLNEGGADTYCMFADIEHDRMNPRILLPTNTSSLFLFPAFQVDTYQIRRNYPFDKSSTLEPVVSVDFQAPSDKMAACRRKIRKSPPI